MKKNNASVPVYYRAIPVGLLLLLTIFLSPSSSKAQRVSISGGNGFDESNKHTNPIPLSLPSSADSDECVALQMDVHGLAQGGSYQKLYDSARYAIEQCALVVGLPFAIWEDFGGATAGCQYKSDDNNRWPPYREWLKKVLYYSPDSIYYCEDVEAIYSTLQYFNAERGNDVNGMLAILQFMKDSSRCLSFFNHLEEDWAYLRHQQFVYWSDTVRNPLNTSKTQDTVLPSLEDLDLQILRGPQYAAVKNAFSPSNSAEKILSLQASENPFTDATTLIFRLANAEYMRVDLYDELGKPLYSDTHLYGEGTNEWLIPGGQLPHATIYARLSAMNGNVRTIKLARR